MLILRSLCTVVCCVTVHFVYLISGCCVHVHGKYLKDISRTAFFCFGAVGIYLNVTPWHLHVRACLSQAYERHAPSKRSKPIKYWKLCITFTSMFVTAMFEKCNMCFSCLSRNHLCSLQFLSANLNNLCKYNLYGVILSIVWKCFSSCITNSNVALKLCVRSTDRQGLQRGWRGKSHGGARQHDSQRRVSVPGLQEPLPGRQLLVISGASLRAGFG